jgi:hypothetical protein
MPASIIDQVRNIAIVAVPIIIAITFHEAAHGYVARAFGDDTAERAGRITLNPLRHIDPFGTILLPAMLYFSTGFMFGYAKPVPVNFAGLRHPKQDMVWVAAAGPVMNLLLSAISVLIIYLFELFKFFPGGFVLQMLWASIEVNLILAIFNVADAAGQATCTDRPFRASADAVDLDSVANARTRCAGMASHRSGTISGTADSALARLSSCMK